MNAPFCHSPHMKQAPRVHLEPDLSKLLAAVSFLIKEGEREGATVTQYDIVKALFLADRAHLNRYGRPITFDNYVAMKHGPVPTLAYDFLKFNPSMLRRYKIKELPWKFERAEHIGAGCIRFFGAFGDDQALAASDIKTLKQAFATVSGMTFRQVRELTHGDPAYKEAWALSGDAGSNLMSLALLYDLPDFEAAEDVAFASRQIKEHAKIDDDFETIYSGLESR